MSTERCSQHDWDHLDLGMYSPELGNVRQLWQFWAHFIVMVLGSMREFWKGSWTGKEKIWEEG